MRPTGPVAEKTGFQVFGVADCALLAQFDLSFMDRVAQAASGDVHDKGRASNAAVLGPDSKGDEMTRPSRSWKAIFGIDLPHEAPADDVVSAGKSGGPAQAN